MTKIKTYLILFVLSFASLAIAQKGSASAGSKKFGFRIQYGFLGADASPFDSQVQGIIASQMPKTKELGFASADLLFMPDAMVYGVRYEFFSSKSSTSVNNRDFESKLSGQRFMALVGWRFLKIQQGYLGVMSHLGAGVNALNYEGLATNNLGVKQTYNYTGKTDYGYGIAVDGGLLCGRIVSDRARNRLHPLRSKLF